MKAAGTKNFIRRLLLFRPRASRQVYVYMRRDTRVTYFAITHEAVRKFLFLYGCMRVASGHVAAEEARRDPHCGVRRGRKEERPRGIIILLSRVNCAKKKTERGEPI